MLSEEVKNKFKKDLLSKLIFKSFDDIECQNFIYLIGASIEFCDYFMIDKEKILLLFDLYFDIIDNLLINDKNYYLIH